MFSVTLDGQDKNLFQMNSFSIFLTSAGATIHIRLLLFSTIRNFNKWKFLDTEM